MTLVDSVAELLGSAVDGLAYSESTDEGNVFTDQLPSDKDRAVCVYSMPGSESDSKLPYDFAAFQIVARGESGGGAVWARTILQAIYSALHGRRSTTLPGGVYVVSILATQASPFNLGEDANGRTQFASNYRAEVRNVTEARPA